MPQNRTPAKRLSRREHLELAHRAWWALTWARRIWWAQGHVSTCCLLALLAGGVAYFGLHFPGDPSGILRFNLAVTLIQVGAGLLARFADRRAERWRRRWRASEDEQRRHLAELSGRG